MENIILDLSSLPNEDNELKTDESIPFPGDFRGEIYIITSKTSGKSYVGQARSHMLKYGVYKPHGYLGRWKAHLQECYGSKRDRCNVLNSAILKYGPEDFEIKLIDYCDIVDINDFKTLNEMEIENIAKYNTLVPNGYNAYVGGYKTILNSDQRKHHSEKLKEHYSDEKNVKRLSDIITTNHNIKKVNKYQGDDNIDFCNVSYYGWKGKVTYEGIVIKIHFKDNKKPEKIHFKRSVLSSMEDMHERVKQFINSALCGRTIYIQYDNFKNYYLSNNNQQNTSIAGLP